MIKVETGKWGQTVEDLRLASLGAAHPRSRERFQALYLIASGQFNATTCGAHIGRQWNEFEAREIVGDPLRNTHPRNSRRCNMSRRARSRRVLTGPRGQECPHGASASSKILVSFKSSVPKPSANQP